MTSIQPIRPNITFLAPVSSKVDWERVVSDWIKTKRSHHTQRAYSKDLNYFLAHEQGLTVENFLRDSHLPTKFPLVIGEDSSNKAKAVLPLTEGYQL